VSHRAGRINPHGFGEQSNPGRQLTCPGSLDQS